MPFTWLNVLEVLTERINTMKRQLGENAVLAIALICLMSLSGVARSADYVVSTETVKEENKDKTVIRGVIKKDGVEVDNINGTGFTFSTAKGEPARFYFAGDLTLNDNDKVTGDLTVPVSFIVGNNAYISPDAVIDFSADGNTGNAGGSSSSHLDGRDKVMQIVIDAIKGKVDGAPGPDLPVDQLVALTDWQDNSGGAGARGNKLQGAGGAGGKARTKGDDGSDGGAGKQKLSFELDDEQATRVAYDLLEKASGSTSYLFDEDLPDASKQDIKSLIEIAAGIKGVGYVANLLKVDVSKAADPLATLVEVQDTLSGDDVTNLLEVTSSYLGVEKLTEWLPDSLNAGHGTPGLVGRFDLISLLKSQNELRQVAEMPEIDLNDPDVQASIDELMGKLQVLAGKTGVPEGIMKDQVLAESLGAYIAENHEFAAPGKAGTGGASGAGGAGGKTVCNKRFLDVCVRRTNTNGNDGKNGSTGGDGGDGKRGSDGVDGLSGFGGANKGVDAELVAGTAGGAGASGGAAGGGGGGGGGGSGGGGGGGGGGPLAVPGGNGGHGGFGGKGDDGGIGGNGGDSGAGGGGGGAFEMIVRGRLDLDGEISVKGGDGSSGVVSGLGGGSRGDGRTGLPGVPGIPLIGGPGSGGTGGKGGDGGSGGQGGKGGSGGGGGGGAGGTVKLVGSVVQGAGSIINVSGGKGQGKTVVSENQFIPEGLGFDDIVDGHNGRVIVGSNVSDTGLNADEEVIRENYRIRLSPDDLDILPDNFPTTTFGDEVLLPTVDIDYKMQGSGGINPFIKEEEWTPYIPDLEGGAELFGSLQGLTAESQAIQNWLVDSPTDASAALLRLDLGPGTYGDNFAGFDMLLFINLMDSMLKDPMLGILGDASDPGFLNPLMSGGYLTDVVFGGSGPHIIGEIAALGIWATLIPESGAYFNFAGGGGTRNSAYLTNGKAAYLSTPVPEPGPLGLLTLGGLLLLMMGVRRRRTERP